ncbi:MAG: twin-arginine translocase TatA/TatE family subunit [Candidatus Competibacteraceae bacterium]
MRIGIGELVLILIVVLLLFGSKRLRGIGTDLSATIKGWRESIKGSGQESIKKSAGKPAEPTVEGRIIEGETVPDEPDTEPLPKQRSRG